MTEPDNRSEPRPVLDGQQPHGRREQPREAHASRRRGPTKVSLTEAECLHALAQLPGLTVTGIITTAQTNALRGVYQTMLANYQQRGSQQPQKLATERLIELVRQQPGLLSLLEPLLTDDQIGEIVRQTTDGHNDDT